MKLKTEKSQSGFVKGKTIILLLFIGVFAVAAGFGADFLFSDKKIPKNGIADVNGVSLDKIGFDRLAVTYRPYLSGLSSREQNSRLVELWVDSQVLKQAGETAIGDERIRFTDPAEEEKQNDGWAAAKRDLETVKESIASRERIYKSRVARLKPNAKIWIHPDYR